MLNNEFQNIKEFFLRQHTRGFRFFLVGILTEHLNSAIIGHCNKYFLPYKLKKNADKYRM